MYTVFILELYIRLVYYILYTYTLHQASTPGLWASCSRGRRPGRATSRTPSASAY